MHGAFFGVFYHTRDLITVQLMRSNWLHSLKAHHLFPYQFLILSPMLQQGKVIFSLSIS
jgi:hypothetical protein